MTLSGKRTIVTGGAGLIGSHLCDQLIAQGYEVLYLDNLFTSSRRAILQKKQFELLRRDVTFPLYVQVDEKRQITA